MHRSREDHDVRNIGNPPVEIFRRYYDVTDEAVEVLAIIVKSDAGAWLQRHGEPETAIPEEQRKAK